MLTAYALRSLADGSATVFPAWNDVALTSKAADSRGGLLIGQVSTCLACEGRGQVIDQPCPACHGTGQATWQDTATVRIPPGIPDGTALRLAGRGMPSPAPGGPPGDAYVIIRMLTDPRFVRDGADLWHTLHIGIPEAVLGTTATVPAPDGQARLPVPPGTQSGVVLVIEGQGLPRYRGHGRGRLNITVIVDIPQQLSPRQRQLYKQLRAEDTQPAGNSGLSAEPGPGPEGNHGRWLHRLSHRKLSSGRLRPNPLRAGVAQSSAGTASGSLRSNSATAGAVDGSCRRHARRRKRPRRRYRRRAWSGAHSRRF